MNTQQNEIKKLREDVHRLQGQCNVMQVQMEKMMEKKKGFFKWKRFGVHGFGNKEKLVWWRKMNKELKEEIVSMEDKHPQLYEN